MSIKQPENEKGEKRALGCVSNAKRTIRGKRLDALWKYDHRDIDADGARTLRHFGTSNLATAGQVL